MPFLRRLLGAALVLAAYAPLHRLLDPERTGPAGRATRDAAEAAWIVGLSGSLIALTVAWLAARMLPRRSPSNGGPGHPGGTIGDPVERILALLAGPSRGNFALAVGLIATTLAATVAWAIHDAGPTSVDEMAQLYHAAALATGRIAIPLEGVAAAWITQNGIAVDAGWASIYPPGHLIFLALGTLAHAAWLVGPVLTGVATGLFASAADRTLGPQLGRSAAVLLLVSPFWLILGAAPSSHASAAAGLTGVLYAGVRARDGGHTGWALASGAVMGATVLVRPWSGLVCGTAILAALWLPGLRARRLGAVVLGGLPFAAALFAWNRSLFREPTRLGYGAAFGPTHGLGLHPDPWGNLYGPVEALAYTGADLLQLGVRLFESPLPATALVGGFLLVARLPPGAGPFAAWAAAGVAAAAAYWHHGLQFGPRMLFETVPAWAALTAAAVLGLARTGRVTATSSRFARAVALIALVGGLALAPTAFRGAARADASGVVTVLDRPADRTRALTEVDGTPPDAVATLVLAHGSWASRISSRLVAAGMRRDSVETALRRNDVCAVDRYARWRSDPVGPPPPLDLVPRPGSPDHLQARTLSAGNRVRVDPARPHDARCLREARADRLGALELESIVWRWPPLPGRRVIVARDLGPATNLRLLDALDLPARVLLAGDDGPILLGYAEGMELLWGGAAGLDGALR